MKKKKYAGILLAISMFISGGCTENRQEDTEIRKPVTISILAGQSTSDAGTEDMIEDAVTERFPQVELQWECVDWGEDFLTECGQGCHQEMCRILLSGKLRM